MHCEFRLKLFVPPLVLIVGIVLFGCGSRTNPIPKTTGSDSKTDPLAGVLHRLEKDSDANTCREVLQAIDSGMTLSDPRPETTPADMQKIAELARLNANEVNALALKEFSTLDADYLSECLLLRDAVRSLEIEGLPAEARGAAAFGWVCRQVYLIDETLEPPYWRPRPRLVIPAPPWWILEDGSGCALDRANVFLSLLRQMGMDGCLIGPPALADSRASRLPAKAGEQLIYAPVRAVGVRIGKEILLFDPKLGKPIPGAAGGKIATLAQIRAKPESSAEWFKSANVSPDEAKTWEVFLTAPTASLSPRMVWLQRQMAATNPVALAVDLIGLIERFQKEALAGESLKGVKCSFWNAPDDHLSLARLHASYDMQVRGPDNRLSNPLKIDFRQSRYPAAFLPAPYIGKQSLEGKPFDMISFVFDREIGPQFLTTGSARDMLLRGQFANALAALDELDRTNAQYRTRISREKDLEQALVEWSQKASPIFADMIRAENSGDAAALAKANDDQKKFLESSASERMLLLVRRGTSLLLSAEAKYLTALIVHERGERIQMRLDANPKDDRLKTEAMRIWDNAADNWKIFLNNFPELAEYHKYRFAHARQLRERALQCLADAKK